MNIVYYQSHNLIVIGEAASWSEGGRSASHEEEDNTIVQWVMSSALNKEESDINMISDDSYVFILLLNYYHAGSIKKLYHNGIIN